MTNVLENLIRRAEIQLRIHQCCTYWKIPNDLRITEDAIVFGDRGPCDFIGHTVGGHALLIEAKSTRDPRLAVPHPRGIKGHQWMALRDADAAGALALVVWMHANEVVILPFKRAKELLGKRKSIPWPGGGSLKGLKAHEATFLVVVALGQCVKTHRDTADTLDNVPVGSSAQFLRRLDPADDPHPATDNAGQSQ